MKFYINNCKGKYAMHCKTEEEAISFCNYLHSIGKVWIDGDTYVNDNGWDRYEVDTCYLFNDGQRRNIDRAVNEGYTILEWSDFMNDMFTKESLKNGDVVKLRNGEVYIVCVETGTLINNRGYCNLSSYKSNLTCYNNDYDIVMVRRPTHPYHCQFCAFDNKYGEIVYERKNEPEEMTLEEICKALGKEIKIVKEH